MSTLTKGLEDEELYNEFVKAIKTGGHINPSTFSKFSNEQLDRILEQANKEMAHKEIDEEDEKKELSDVSHINSYDKITNNYAKLDIVLTYFHGKNKYYFHVNPKIFSSGHFKIAYRATLYKSNVVTYGDYNTPSIADNTSVVLKIKKYPGFSSTTPDPIMQRSGWDTDIKELNTLKIYTTEWNKQQYSDKTYNVSQASVLKVSDIGSDGTGMFKKNEYVMVEPYMPSFAKWNWPSSAEKDAKSLSIQAFGHYTYHSSKGKILINDAQGYRDSDKYVITDPYFLYSDKHNSTIKNWFNDHHCNKFCKSWWRRPRGTRSQQLSGSYYPSNSNGNKVVCSIYGDYVPCD